MPSEADQAWVEQAEAAEAEASEAARAAEPAADAAVATEWHPGPSAQQVVAEVSQQPSPVVPIGPAAAAMQELICLGNRTK